MACHLSPPATSTPMPPRPPPPLLQPPPFMPLPTPTHQHVGPNQLQAGAVTRVTVVTPRDRMLPAMPSATTPLEPPATAVAVQSATMRAAPVWPAPAASRTMWCRAACLTASWWRMWCRMGPWWTMPARAACRQPGRRAWRTRARAPCAPAVALCVPRFPKAPRVPTMLTTMLLTKLLTTMLMQHLRWPARAMCPRPTHHRTPRRPRTWPPCRPTRHPAHRPP